jgi:hypothetical protein
LYLQLSKVADSYIQQAFEENEGLRLTETGQLTARIGQLLAEAEGRTD